MSQAKVDKYKQEKYNRKNAPKKPKFKKFLAYAGSTVAAAAIIIYAGYSIAVETGLYTPPETTSAYVGSVSSAELESMLQSSGDQLGFYTKALSEANANNTEEATTVAEETTATEETTVAEESTEE